MSYIKPNNSEREKSAHGRFELMCERFINGNDRDRRIILSFLNEDEKHIFLVNCGLYRLFRDQKFYNAIKKAVGEQLYNDYHK